MIKYFIRELEEFDGKFVGKIKEFEREIREMWVEKEKKKRIVWEGIRRERKEREKRKRSEEVRKMRRKNEEESREIEEFEERSRVERERKEAELGEKIKMIVKEKENRKKKILQGNQRYLLVKRSKPLFEKIQEEYDANEMLAMQEIAHRSQSKKQEICKSIDVDTLTSHQSHYLGALKSQENLRNKKRKQAKFERLIKNTSVNYYKPKIKNILQEEKEKELERQIEQEEIKAIRLQKQKTYGRLVQELYCNASPVRLVPILKPSPTVKKKYTPNVKIKRRNSVKRAESNEKSSKKSVISSRSMDFLLNRRKIQSENFVLPSINIPTSQLKSVSTPEKANLLTRNGKVLERQPKILDFLYNSTDISILQNEIISSAYINSIKAKLKRLSRLIE